MTEEVEERDYERDLPPVKPVKEFDFASSLPRNSRLHDAYKNAVTVLEKKRVLLESLMRVQDALHNQILEAYEAFPSTKGHRTLLVKRVWEANYGLSLTAAQFELLMRAPTAGSIERARRQLHTDVKKEFGEWSVEFQSLLPTEKTQEKDRLYSSVARDYYAQKTFESNE